MRSYAIQRIATKSPGAGRYKGILVHMAILLSMYVGGAPPVTGEHLTKSNALDRNNAHSLDIAFIHNRLNPFGLDNDKYSHAMLNRDVPQSEMTFQIHSNQRLTYRSRTFVPSALTTIPITGTFHLVSLQSNESPDANRNYEKVDWHDHWIFASAVFCAILCLKYFVFKPGYTDPIPVIPPPPAKLPVATIGFIKPSKG